MSKIDCRSFQRVIKEGQRLKMIKLENYNSAEEIRRSRVAGPHTISGQRARE